jgi:hypothetical protein
MSPKRRVLLMAVIFGMVGVGVSIVIIAIGGGFSGPGASIINPPTSKDIWTIGDNIHNGMVLNYSLSSIGPASSLQSATVSIDFVQKVGEDWNTTFTIINGTGAKAQDTLVMSNQLTRKGEISEQFRPFFEPVQSSVLAISDIAIGPKYLVIGAPWNTILTGSVSVPIRVTDRENLQTPAGTFDSYVLSYKLSSNTSKIWIAHGIPTPIKAEVYDAQDHLQYRYELTGLQNGS